METLNRNPGREFDGTDLIWLINEYLAEASSRVASLTLHNYTYFLDFFVRWWDSTGPAKGWIVRRATFQEFARWLEQQAGQRGKSLVWNTVDTMLRRLRQVFRWAHTEEFFARDYSLWIPRATGEAAAHEAPDPVACLEKLFLACDEMSKPARNKALLAVLIGTGVRRAECVNIAIEQIRFVDDGSGKIFIESGKGSRPRTVVFDAIAGHYIALHVTALGRTTGALFIGHSKRMKPKSLNGVLGRIVVKAGLTDKIHGPHDLRRMFATYWSRKQRGEGFTQPLALQLGHTGQAMTLHYSKQDLSDVERVFTSPLEVLG